MNPIELDSTSNVEISLVYTKIRAFEGATHAALYFKFGDGREIVFRGGPTENNQIGVEFMLGSDARQKGGDLDPSLIVMDQKLGVVNESKAVEMLKGLNQDILQPVNNGNIEYVPYTLNPFSCSKNSNTVAWLGATYIGLGFNSGDRPIDPRYGNPILAPGLGCTLPGINLDYIKEQGKAFQTQDSPNIQINELDQNSYQIWEGSVDSPIQTVNNPSTLIDVLAPTPIPETPAEPPYIDPGYINPEYPIVEPPYIDPGYINPEYPIVEPPYIDPGYINPEYPIVEPPYIDPGYINPEYPIVEPPYIDPGYINPEYPIVEPPYIDPGYIDPEYPIVEPPYIDPGYINPEYPIVEPPYIDPGYIDPEYPIVEPPYINPEYPIPDFPTYTPDYSTPSFPTYTPDYSTPSFPTYTPDYSTPSFPTYTPDYSIPSFPTYTPDYSTPSFPTYTPDYSTSSFPTYTPDYSTSSFPTYTPDYSTSSFPTYTPDYSTSSFPTYTPDYSTPSFPTYTPDYSTSSFPTYTPDYSTSSFPTYTPDYSTSSFPTYTPDYSTSSFPTYTPDYSTSSFPTYTSDYSTPSFPTYTPDYSTPSFPTYTPDYSTPSFPTYTPDYSTPSFPGFFDPIVIDLTDDGFNLLAAETSSAHFDILGGGKQYQTGWAGSGNGLLAYDVDNDSLINHRSEIAFIDYKPGAKTDLEGLTAFDTNNNGWFEKEDAKWDQFGVWEDKNVDGVTDSGEYYSLDALGIQSIYLTSDHQRSVMNGNIIHGVTQVTMQNGSSLLAADVSFNVSSQVLI